MGVEQDRLAEPGLPDVEGGVNPSRCGEELEELVRRPCLEKWPLTSFWPTPELSDALPTTRRGTALSAFLVLLEKPELAAIRVIFCVGKL